MTASQTESVVRLLLTLCPAKQPRIDKDFAAAWIAALEPYAFTDVKNAALKYARQKVFFPAVSDLLTGLQPDDMRNDLARAQMLLRSARQTE